ncbi:sodium-independent anion transporter [Bacillus sp. T3]|uniref:sodium-independent anion transporter n=1 Tax=Bacillus sp. T3 TaxID=467262 RepID=UPI0029812D66|nr:sodium-independent anion transporter [Bacillus sp. T3]
MFEQSIMSTINHRPLVLILRMAKVPYMDTTGEGTLNSIVRHFQRQGGTILVSSVQEQPMEVLKKSGLYNKIGGNQFFEHTGDAINYALTHLNYNKCIGCRHFAFQECRQLSQTAETQEIGRKMTLQV